MSESQRNAVVVIAIALVVYLLFNDHGNGATARVSQLFNLAFLVLIGFAMVVWYRNRAGTISLMDRRWRTLLQVCGVGLFVTYATGAGLPRPHWSTWSGGCTLLFFLLLGGFAYGAYRAWQSRSWRW